MYKNVLKPLAKIILPTLGLTAAAAAAAAAAASAAQTRNYKINYWIGTTIQIIPIEEMDVIIKTVKPLENLVS